MNNNFPACWFDLIETSGCEFDVADRIARIENAVARIERTGTEVFPPVQLRYRAFDAVAPEKVKVVIVGQDPYPRTENVHGKELPQAVGLSFSVPSGMTLPPSLQNIFQELADDLGVAPPTDGNLSHWANQGVLMLNTILTVERGNARSHSGLGWQDVTTATLRALSSQRKGLVFILWGNDAKALKEHIMDVESRGHVILESSHPSPMGGSCYRGFFGSKPFSRTNAALIAQGKKPIAWLG